MEDLIHAIRHKCQQQGWYGPDCRAYRIEEHDPRRTGFLFPPATKAQLAAAEESLGFALPAALRAIYASLANGGFGPGWGMRGVVGGESAGGGTIETWYDGWIEHHVTPLEHCDVQEGEKRHLPFPQWPRFLISICNWGCGIQIGLDCSTGRIFQIGPVEGGACLTPLAPSLEEYLWKWVRDELYPPVSVQVADGEGNPFA